MHYYLLVRTFCNLIDHLQSQWSATLSHMSIGSVGVFVSNSVISLFMFAFPCSLIVYVFFTLISSANRFFFVSARFLLSPLVVLFCRVLAPLHLSSSSTCCSPIFPFSHIPFSLSHFSLFPVTFSCVVSSVLPISNPLSLSCILPSLICAGKGCEWRCCYWWPDRRQ